MTYRTIRVTREEAERMLTITEEAAYFYRTILGIRDSQVSSDIWYAFERIRERLTDGETGPIDLPMCAGYALAIDLFDWFANLQKRLREPRFSVKSLEKLKAKLS